MSTFRLLAPRWALTYRWASFPARAAAAGSDSQRRNWPHSWPASATRTQPCSARRSAYGKLKVCGPKAVALPRAADSIMSDPPIGANDRPTKTQQATE